MDVICKNEDIGIVTITVDSLNQFGGADIDDLQVLKSAAGYYIGSLYKEDDGVYYPFMRDSECYWPTRAMAEGALITGDYRVKF